MKDLKYATSVSTKHDVSVKTWTEGDEQFVEMRVDGRVLSSDSLGPVGE